MSAAPPEIWALPVYPRMEPEGRNATSQQYPSIEEMLEDGKRDAEKIKRATEEMFLLWMAQAERLWICKTVHGKIGKAFKEFARRIGVDYTSAKKLVKFYLPLPHLNGITYAKLAIQLFQQEEADAKARGDNGYRWRGWLAAYTFLDKKYGIKEDENLDDEEEEDAKITPEVVADLKSKLAVAEVKYKNETNMIAHLEDKLQAAERAATQRENDLNAALRRIAELENQLRGQPQQTADQPTDQPTVDQPTSQVLPFPDRRAPAEPDKAPEQVQPRPARPMTPAFMPPGTVSGLGSIPPVVTRRAPSPPSDVPEYKAPVAATVEEPAKKAGRGRQPDPIKTVAKLKIVAAQRIKDALADPNRTVASVKAKIDPIWKMMFVEKFEGDELASYRAFVWDRLLNQAEKHGFNLDTLTWEGLTGSRKPTDPDEPPKGGAPITPPAQDAPDDDAIDSATPPDGAAPETSPETPPETGAGSVAISTGAQLEAAISDAETYWGKAGYSVATVFQALAPIFEKTANNLNGVFYGRIANLATMCASTPKPPGFSHGWLIFWDGVTYCYADAIELHVGTYSDAPSPATAAQDTSDGAAIDSATAASAGEPKLPETGAKAIQTLDQLKAALAPVTTEPLAASTEPASEEKPERPPHPQPTTPAPGHGPGRPRGNLGKLKTAGEAVRRAPDDGVATSAASVMGGTAEDVDDHGEDAARRNSRWRGALQGALMPAGWNLKKLGAIIPASHAEFADFIEILRKLHPVLGPQPHYSGEQITDDAIWWNDQYLIVRREGKLLKVNVA